MPSSRRRAPPTVTALSAARLPIGTPHLPTPRSSSAPRSTSSINHPSLPSRQPASPQYAPLLTQPERFKMATEHPHSVSLAEAKLARQTKRNEQAEVALNASIPAASQRDRLPSKAKGKWKPLDLAADTANPHAEVRVNTFRPATTRKSSLTRSLSSLSQRSTTLSASGMERHDSGLRENTGFQLYVNRKNKKVVDQLDAYQDKPEPKQATVEAPVDRREIYEVFGNAPPGPDFINQNPGAKNGQLQFIQHPNGDIAAHQWSIERYVWENIGQFSNIRKRIEGQLAADRLKGETAHQTLQQNTLAYFRTVAKQREAAVMGLPFGPQEIQSAMPEPRAPPAAPLAMRKSAQVENASVSTKIEPDPRSAQKIPGDSVAPRMHAQARASITSPGYAYETYPEDAGNIGHTGFDGAPLYPYAPHLAAYTVPYHERYGHNMHHAPMGYAIQDPFYPEVTYRTMYSELPMTYGGRPVPQRYYVHSNSHPDLIQQVSSLNYDYHFPPAPTTSSRQRASRADTVNERLTIARNTSTNLVPATVLPKRPSSKASLIDTAQTPDRTKANVIYEVPLNHGTSTTRLQSVTPSSSRTAMRDQLMKLGDQAKERNISQTNIRTVLYDPFRAHPEANDQQSASEPITVIPLSRSETKPTELKKTVANPSGILPKSQTASTPSMAARPFNPAVGSEREAQPNIQQTVYESGLDPWSSGPPSTGPLAIESGQSKSAPQANAQGYNEELKTWWHNGTNFARHEDMYKSIKANSLQIPSTASTSRTAAPTLASTSTPIKAAPIVLPSPGPSLSAAATTAPHVSNTIDKGDALARLLIPVWENLASYIQGPSTRRRDYFTPWTQPPEYAIDRSNTSSFYDEDWGQPPARIGRDPRYRPLTVTSSPTEGGGSAGHAGRHGGGDIGAVGTPVRFGSGAGAIGSGSGTRAAGVEGVRFGEFISPTASGLGKGLLVGPGLERQFPYGKL